MAAGDLTTLANVKQYLGLTVTTDDLLLARLITAASAWIKTFTNRDILTTVYTEAVDGLGTERMVLGNYPITAITSIAVLNDVPILPANVVFDAGVITRIDGGVFPFGKSNITLVYTAGYSTVPLNLEEDCIEIVALRYREKDRVGTTSINAKGESVVFSVMDVPTSVKSDLKNWRNVVPV